MNLICVPPNKVRLIWPNVWHLIYESMKRGDFGAFKPVEDDVLNGDALLWLATDGENVAAACVTQITQSEWRKVCSFVALGGIGIERWFGLLPEIEAYAKAEGCHSMRVVGRKGWARLLPTYQEHRVVLEKEL